jgi:hypothetical protein
MPVEQLGGDGRAQRRTSASARIRCGTLASDAMRVKPAAQERQTQTAARDRVACFTPRPRDLQATEHQVEGGGVNDSCCSYAAHRVFASDEIRGGRLIPHESAAEGNGMRIAPGDGQRPLPPVTKRRDLVAHNATSCRFACPANGQGPAAECLVSGIVAGRCRSTRHRERSVALPGGAALP